MQIINRYLTREILKYFIIIMTMVVGIYFIVDFFEKIDNFLDVGASVTIALLFFIYKIPFIISQILPVAILLAILVTFGLMSRNNEIIALRSSGVSTFLLFRPLISIGIICGILLFFLSEVIVPITMERANRIYLTEVKKVAAITAKEKNIWIKRDHAIYHISYYDPTNQLIFGLSAHFFNDQFQLIKRIDARSGRFKEGSWVLKDFMLQEIDADTEEATVSFHRQQAVSSVFQPEDLKRVAKSSKEMGFAELLSFIKKIESEGYNADKYRVDLNAKIAFPVACIIMCLVGTGIAVRGKLKEGIPVIVAYGIGIAFLYWVASSFFISLGYGAMLHPIASAWMANIIFLGAGSIAVLRSN
jgi:lipopolysaccharide export system permease protein